MEYKEFTNDIKKRRTAKKMRVTHSWGVYDAYKAIRKSKWQGIGKPLKEHEFYNIIRGVNELLAKEIAQGNDVHLPHGMGALELRKMEAGVSLVDGKLRNTYPIDWEKTLKLWFADEESRRSKTLVRNEVKYLYYVKYNKHDAHYKNQCFYEFALNRFIKLALKDNINKGKIDALW